MAVFVGGEPASASLDPSRKVARLSAIGLLPVRGDYARARE